jgi:hypothetical protein
LPAAFAAASLERVLFKLRVCKYNLFVSGFVKQTNPETRSDCHNG